MDWAVDAAVAAKIGFATHQNAIPVIRDLSVAAPADSDGPRTDLILTLKADPPFVQPKTWRIDRMMPGDVIHVADRDVALNATLLQELTESIFGSLTLTLTDSSGATLVEGRHPVELLAHNQWGGVGSMAELLPAFVMPNDPAVDRVLKGASDVLRSAGKPDGIDGYQSGKRERVWELASAIWSSVAGLRISYALPPANFEQTGQKIRTPSQILEGRLATCLDTALLFAAALEQSSLNPLLILTKDHAFVGIWLQPVEFAALATDEAAALRRRCDLDDLVVFETTLAAQSSPASFSQAIATARRQIAEEADASFELVIDVRRARMQKIRPLGVAVANRTAEPDKPSMIEGLEAAPALPAFDVEIDEEGSAVGGRIAQWQRRLLNLTTSNALLNLRDSKTVIKLLCPDPAVLEDLLADGRKVKIVPMPDLQVGGRDEKLYEQQTQTSLRAEVAAQAMARGEALSLLAKDKLDASLVELYRKARTDLEEGGANTLYLALGFLKWKKSAAEEKVYRAPLILLPIRLDRKSALSGVTMVIHEDEPRFNLTLLELLRQDFELTISGLEGELPRDHSGIDVGGIWRSVRAAVRDIAGFEVVPEVALGTFSFAKYLMWKDLVDRADRLKESPLVRHLIDRDGSVLVDKGRFPQPEEMDAKVDPASLFTPLPADSSQLVAVIASAEQRNFVLDGPPGTGKSQTIANMIAHNLALGRRVLFVAEKRAALDVVHRRLADKGLAPFCLELHSAKATKSAVLKQLDSAWTARDGLTQEEWDREAADTRRARDELNDVVEILHRRDACGWTIHQAIGRTVRDANGATPKLSFPGSTHHSTEDLARFREIARRLGTARKDVVDLGTEFEGVACAEWSNGWQEDIIAAAAGLPAALYAVEAARDGLTVATRLPLRCEDRRQLESLLSFADMCLAMHGQDLRLAFAPDMMDRVKAARDGMAIIIRYRTEEAALSAAYAPEAARRIDIEGMRTAWSVASGKFSLLATLAKRKVAKSLARAGAASSAIDCEMDLPRLAAMRDLLIQIDKLPPHAATIPGWAGLVSDQPRIEQVITLAEQLRAAIAAEADGPETLVALRAAASALIVDANEMLAQDGAVAVATEKLRDALKSFDAVATRFNRLAGTKPDASFAEQKATALAVTAHARRLRDWTNWRRVRDEAVDVGLSPLVDALEHSAIAPEAVLGAFETAYARWFAFTRIDQEPLLMHFMAGEQQDRIARFRKLDDRMGELATRYIRAKLCGLIPEKSEVGKKDGYGTLKHQLQLSRPSMPIRKLAAEMGDAFTRLAPCMLMSPLSVAQYLPTDQALFDLVIFDEASQITPWDAIGAMARGKQVIIAGDPRQMPPSNNFERSTGTTTADDDIDQDMPSILDECIAAGVPQHSLDWHYRSRHESLIAFSNTRYYQSKLVTFPAPETRPSAVMWKKVPGVYTAGARTNPIEAQAIVDEAVRRLRDPRFIDEKGEPLTLGIITMNAEQMRLVEDLLDKAQRAHPEIVRHFDEKLQEPVCVRNLETVQGDERDLILLGVNFGPTVPAGKTMSMSFGKLNPTGGWRRLNVAATRARREMQVFTSFEPGMIDLTRTASDGVRDLKAFIEFADRGPRALAEATKGSMGGVDSPFEEAVMMALKQRGWSIIPQVGVSKFRIDLGVVHPDRPGDYLVGVECDGAAYHSAATARDRDKVRASILESLGWSLLRIWSTDWWIDKERAADRLHGQIEALLAAERERTAERDTAAAASVESPHPDTDAEVDAALTHERAQIDEGFTSSDPLGAVDAVCLMPVPVPAYARAAMPEAAAVVAPAMQADEIYRCASFNGLAPMISAEHFYEPSYDATLRTLVEHVLESEAPLAETLLVQRVARAHGFQRAGRIIRDRVMAIVEHAHFVEQEDTGGRFVWSGADQQANWNLARFPATLEDVRQIEDIPLGELRAAKRGRDAVDVARGFGVRRLSALARSRIENS